MNALRRRLDPSLDCARALDADDELGAFRRRFALPRDGARTLVYLCGHSLGLMPKEAPRLVQRELDRWAERGVDGHFEADGAGSGWFDYHERFAAPLAELTGAMPREVVAMNTLTVNLHLMLVSFFRPTRDRYKIVIERNAFPSDRYAVQSQLRWHGLDPAEALLELAPPAGARSLGPDALDALLEREGERVALVLLPGVQYLTGEALDLAAAVRTARKHGCRIGFDLAHAVGNVPLALHRSGADFAVWCSYKYLNAGPGAVGGCFVHERAAAEAGLPRLAGWWGHVPERRFAADREFRPMAGAAAWQLSNPPILSLAPLAASLALFEEAGLERLRAKSERLTRYLEFLLEAKLPGRVEVLTPAEPQRRGCQLSLRIVPAPRDGRELARRLRAAGVVGDWREPDVLRLAPVPLYNRFRDVYDAVQALAKVLDE
ncbi:MAG TPA: kynureninase [Gammaproteobacteria bacterium]